MRLVLKVISCVPVALAIISTAQAKEWRGIVPLYSTREDVEKLLGPPPPPPDNGTRIYKLNKTRSIYFPDEGEVYIVFAEKEIPAAASCLGTIPAGTVLLIQVTPQKALRLSDLELDERKLKKFDPAQPPNSGFEGYVDEEQGVSTRIQEGKVQVINYFAAEKDTHLCPTYYASPKWFCSIFVH